MDLFERRRFLLGGKSLLPFVIWQNGMSSVSEIPISYVESHCTLIYRSYPQGTFIFIEGQSGPYTKSVSFTIPAIYIKKAKWANITWFVPQPYGSCNVKITCGGHTLQDTGEENYQTRIFNSDISSFNTDMTVTFTGDQVRIMNFVIT